MSFCGALGALAVYHHQWIQLLSDTTADGYLLDASVGDRGLARVPPFEAVELELEALFLPAA